MSFSTRIVSCGVMWVLFTGSGIFAADSSESIPTALFDYINRPEEVFAWKLIQKHTLDDGAVYDVQLTSQKWHELIWTHSLQIYEPKEIRYPDKVLLFVTGGRNGGKPRGGDRLQGLRLARQSNARVAMLHQVPSQPILGDRYEDDLITETWLRYLDSGDATWPLLFPMVKSAVKAMDAIEQIALHEWDARVTGFVITGASKRGWTSWLTPVADRRVIATAPIVIDVLNFRAQMKHQLDSWGKYSEQIHDYSSKGLIVEGDETDRERELRRMMDPYTYRKLLTLPKLLINGTNDPYWVADAMQHYWDDLEGPKFILQVPNAGHGLEGGREHATSTLAAYFQHQASGTPLPDLNWHTQESDDFSEFHISSSKSPVEARYWVATSSERDFRQSRWNPRPLEKNGKGYGLKLPRPEEGHIAHYAELVFDLNGLPFSLCTPIRVSGVR